MPFQQDELVGLDFNGYQVRELLYEGGFSQIYAAASPTGQVCAMKVVLPEHAKNSEFRLRFMREIRLLQAVKHPNIVPILSFGFKHNIHYLIMPLIEGKDLGFLLAEKRFNPQEVGVFVAHIAGALHSGHAKGIVHRDLKPENILVDLTGDSPRYLLTDFGLAKQPGVDKDLTAAGRRVGTPFYTSPESLQGLADPQGDLYSLTVIVYELLLGQIPFDDDNMYEVILAHVKSLPPSPRHLNPSFPPTLEAFLLKNLAKEKAERSPDAPTYQAEYEAALASLSAEEQTRVYWVE
jgi:serine/threonine-protein kinase